MASGDHVSGLMFQPPSASPASRDFRVAATTGETFAVYDFDDSTAENLDAFGRLSAGYSGGGLTLKAGIMSTSATTGNVVMTAAVRRRDTSDDADATHSYVANSTTVAAAVTNGALTYFTITFTNGADMDNLAAGEAFVLRISRDASSGSDTMIGDAELDISTVELIET